MAVYRHIHIDFWQDGFILDLTPEEKYFYMYLMLIVRQANVEFMSFQREL